MLASFDRRLHRGQAGSTEPAPAASDAPPAAKAIARLVIYIDDQGKVMVNGTSVDAAQLDALFARADQTTEAVIRYGKDTPAEARNAVLERAQAAGCRVSFVRN